jgi:hypothetical protein
MPDESKDWGELWRAQGGGPPVELRRMRSRTRSEVLYAIAAALFFAAIIAWRFAGQYGRVPWLGVGAMLVWAVVSLIWFRDRIWRGAPSAAPGVEHYRRELERRRDHLRNSWLWHGPLAAAILTLASIPTVRRLETAAPMLVLLAGWTIFGTVRRRRQAADLQREIDELAEPRP